MLNYCIYLFNHLKINIFRQKYSPPQRGLFGMNKTKQRSFPGVSFHLGNIQEGDSAPVECNCICLLTGCSVYSRVSPSLVTFGLTSNH